MHIIPSRITTRRWVAEHFYQWAKRLDYHTINSARRFAHGKKCSLGCGRDANCLHQFWALTAATPEQTQPNTIDISAERGSVCIQTPLCGQCFDLLRDNTRLSSVGGYDFRPMYRCTNKWHKTGHRDTEASFLKRGLRLIDVQVGYRNDREGLMSLWGCPNPRCQAVTIREMPEEPTREMSAAAERLFGGVRDAAAKHADRARGTE